MLTAAETVAEYYCLIETFLHVDIRIFFRNTGVGVENVAKDSETFFF